MLLIKTEEENNIALRFVERLMKNDPEPQSKEGVLLSFLVEHVRVFEKRYD